MTVVYGTLNRVDKHNVIFPEIIDDLLNHHFSLSGYTSHKSTLPWAPGSPWSPETHEAEAWVRGTFFNVPKLNISLHLAQRCYLSEDIICSLKQTVFRERSESLKSVKAILFNILHVFFENWIINMFVNNKFLKTGEYRIFTTHSWGIFSRLMR